MNRLFVNVLLVVMLIALLIMTATGIMFFFDIKSAFAMELHKITGPLFITLIIIHIITFRKVAYNFLFGARETKSK